MLKTKTATIIAAALAGVGCNSNPHQGLNPEDCPAVRDTARSAVEARYKGVSRHDAGAQADHPALLNAIATAYQVERVDTIEARKAQAERVGAGLFTACRHITGAK